MFPIATSIAFEQARPPAADASTPMISVAVSLYDYALHVEACLASVAAQHHPRLELIVVDDASTDASLDAARRWLEANHSRFERAMLVTHLENQGLSQARNTAFELAQADHVFVLDADNSLYPRALARLQEPIDGSGAGAAYSQLALFGDTVQPGYADVWRPERFKPANYVDAMALVSKAAWRAVGGYDQLDIGWEDYDFWCKFVDHGIAAIYVPEILCRYRVHGQSMLRAGTDLKLSRIRQKLMQRHPWLDL